MIGTFTIQRNLELLGRYRYAEIQFMELVGSWAHTIVDPEINRVLYRVHWIDELTKDDPERRKRVLAYPDQVLADQHPVGVYFKETKNT